MGNSNYKILVAVSAYLIVFSILAFTPKPVASRDAGSEPPKSDPETIAATATDGTIENQLYGDWTNFTTKDGLPSNKI